MSEVVEPSSIKIEPATLEDVEPLTDLLVELFDQEADFTPDHQKQMRGVRLIIENPNRGRIFVMRSHGRIVGMVNLLITISTAEGGFVLLLEDLIVRRDFRGAGLGSKLLEYACKFATDKHFHRITLLTDLADNAVIGFYEKRGFKRSQMVPMRLNLELPEASTDSLNEGGATATL